MKKGNLTHAGTLGSRMKLVRLHFGYTRSRMAGRLDVGTNTVSRYEQDRMTPGMTVLSILSRELDVSMDWLLFGRGVMLFQEPPPPKESSAAGMVEKEPEELMEHMVRIPLLRHEMLAQYHKFKLQYKELFEPTP